MQITFALVSLLPFLTAVLGAPLQDQGLVKRRIFNYEPDLSVAARKTESPDAEIRRSHHEGRSFDLESKRHEESPDAEIRRKRHEDGGLAVEVKREEDGGLAIEVKRQIGEA